MKQFLIFVAILFLPGGIIILIFRLWRRGIKKIIELFSDMKKKILS